MRQVFTSGEQYRTVTNNAVSYQRYSGHGYINSWAAVADREQGIVGATGTLENLFFELAGSPGAGKSYEFAIYLNGAKSALTCTISDTETSANSGATQLSVTEGDLICIIATPSGTPTAREAIMWSCDFVGDNQNESWYEGGTWGDFNGVATRYFFPFCGQSSAKGVESTASGLVSINGTITKYYVGSMAAPSGHNLTYYLYINGVQQAASGLTLTDGQTLVGKTGLSLDIAPGDTVSIEAISAYAQIHQAVRTGLCIECDEGDQYILSGATADTVRTDGNTEDQRLISSSYYYDSHDGLRKQGSGITTFYASNFRVKLTNAPGVGKSWTWQIKNNSATVTNTVIVDETNTVGTESAVGTFEAEQFVSISVTGNSTPAAMGDNKWAAIGSTLSGAMKDPISPRGVIPWKH